MNREQKLDFVNAKLIFLHDRARRLARVRDVDAEDHSSLWLAFETEFDTMQQLLAAARNGPPETIDPTIAFIADRCQVWYKGFTTGEIDQEALQADREQFLEHIKQMIEKYET